MFMAEFRIKCKKCGKDHVQEFMMRDFHNLENECEKIKCFECGTSNEMKMYDVVINMYLGKIERQYILK